MDELPPLFQDIEFHVVWKGYDSEEVDAYVDRVAKAAALVHGRLSELQQRAEAAEARAASGGGTSFASSETEETLTRTLVLAQRTADAAIAEAKAEAAQLIASAEGQAQIALREATSAAVEVTKEADDHASRVMAEAETDRRKLLADAETEAAAAASSEHERLANEVHELEQYRAFLVDDVDMLERHLSEQRSVLAASVSALSDLVERPEAFRVDPAPETSGAVPPAVANIDLLEELAPADAQGLAAEGLAAEGLVDEGVDLAQPEPEAEIPVAAAADHELVVAEETVAADALEAAVEPEIEPTLEPVEEFAAEPVIEMPPVIAVDGAVEFIDVTPVADPAVHEPDLEPMTEHDDATQWTAPVAAWDEPAFSDSASVESGPTNSAPIDEAPAASLIDLTAPDPDSADETAVAAQIDAPAPPLLVTAADFDPAMGTEADDGELMVEEPTAPMPVIDETLFSEPIEESGDPFLDQLRDAVAFDDVDLGDDALAAFFDQDDDPAGRGWFGRRR